jgi:outer membrane protein assembly factor BamE
MRLSLSKFQPRLATVVVALLATAIAGSGCVYRMPIQQGNFLEAGTIEQLQTGMTRTQVVFLLGTPMVPPGFDSSRWEYYYYFKNRRLQRAEERRVTVFFENDKVARVERDNPQAKPAG